MSIEKINLAIKMMESTGEEILTTGGVISSLIRQAEQKLKIKFTEDYKYFLEKFGCLSFEGEEFYGSPCVRIVVASNI